MTEQNEDKQIEEFIREKLKNYSLPPSESLKQSLIQEFQNIKHKHPSINLSFQNLITNPTFKFILISILFIILIIYLFIKIFPSSSQKNFSNSSLTNTDTTNNKPHSNNISNADTLHTIDKNITSKDTIHPSSKQKNNSQSLPTDTTRKIITHKAEQIISNTDTSDKINNELPKKKKKKRKREQQNTSSTDEVNNLPVLEPKTPELKPNTKEEE